MTQISHTPDPGLCFSRTMAVDQVRDLAQVAKIVVRIILGVARRTRRLPRAWWIGLLAV